MLFTLGLVGGVIIFLVLIGICQVLFHLLQAADLRGTTPLLAAYKSGHYEVVEWLLAHVAHLPSDPECNKALLAPMPSDTDLAPQRDKCFDLIMKVG